MLRDFGDVRAAIREFRLTRAVGEPGREADVLTSLGTALVRAGRTEAGVAALDEALARAVGGAAATGSWSAAEAHCTSRATTTKRGPACARRSR